MSDCKYFCKSQLKELGFTEKMIRDLVLKKPILKTNPHYKKASPMQIWEQTYIYDIMNSNAYSVAKAKAENRKRASRKALLTKRDKSMALLKEAIASITIMQMNPFDIEKNALNEKALWYEHLGRDELDVSFADQYTINRWCINYIRHKLTNYEEVLYKFKKNVGKEELYSQFREAVMEKIYEVYPQFFNDTAA